MGVFSPLVASSVGAADGAQAQAAAVPSSQFIFPTKEAFRLNQTIFPPRRGGGRSRSLLLVIALLAATVATAFLVIRCFKALQPGKTWSSYGLSKRSLAEGGSGSCNVGLDQQ